MTQDIYNLKWNNFNGNIDFNLKELLFGNKLSDVTLVSDDKIAFKAHKFVLGACSPVLRDLLRETFQSYESEATLYFMYLGKTQFYPSRMKAFFEVGKELQINQLKGDLTMKSDNNDNDNTFKQNKS